MMKQAITLVEIVIVMAIVAVVSAVTIVSIDYIVPKKVEATARKIIAELRWFREYVAVQMDDDPFDYGDAQLKVDTVRGNYIEFWEGDYDDSSNNNLIKTVYFDNPGHLITSPVFPPPPNDYYSIIFDRRSAARKAIPVTSLDIDIDGKQKISIEDETGYIQYVR